MLTVRDIMTNKNYLGNLEFVDPLADFLRNFVLRNSGINPDKEDRQFDFFYMGTTNYKK